MITLTTPTGHIGHQVLDILLLRGEQVRVVVRDPDRLGPEARHHVEVVQGAHDDPAVVAEAFAGVDAVLLVIPPNPRSDSVESHYQRFTQAACDAVVGQHVPRVVAVSSMGRSFPTDAGLLTPAFAMDDGIERTGVAYRALRMPFFMENILSQVASIRDQSVFVSANTADRRLPTVATADIALVAAALLVDRSWTGQDSVPLAGPDDLSPGDMVQVMSEVLGHRIRLHQVSPLDLRSAMTQRGVSDAWAAALADMVAAQNDGVYDQDLASPGSRTSTSFRRWCEVTLAAAVAG